MVATFVRPFGLVLALFSMLVVLPIAPAISELFISILLVLLLLAVGFTVVVVSAVVVFACAPVFAPIIIPSSLLIGVVVVGPPASLAVAVILLLFFIEDNGLAVAALATLDNGLPVLLLPVLLAFSWPFVSVVLSVAAASATAAALRTGSHLVAVAFVILGVVTCLRLVFHPGYLEVLQIDIFVILLGFRWPVVPLLFVLRALLELATAAAFVVFEAVAPASAAAASLGPTIISDAMPGLLFLV